MESTESLFVWFVVKKILGLLPAHILRFFQSQKAAGEEKPSW